MTEGRTRRVFHDGAGAPEAVLALTPEEAHHVRDVLRMRAGDALSVCDGQGREWDAALVRVAREEVTVRLGSELSDVVEPDLAVTVYQGLCRPDRMEWAIQKLVEVGAAAIRPVAAERSEGPRPSPDRLERWRRIAREACKQCGRRKVPEVDAPVRCPPAPPSGVLGLLLDGCEHAIGAALRATPRAEGVWIAVGPEGGFAAEESAALERQGWRRVSLGPRTLRTETAGVVACALVLHAWSDLGSARG